MEKCCIETYLMSLKMISSLIESKINEERYNVNGHSLSNDALYALNLVIKTLLKEIQGEK